MVNFEGFSEEFADHLFEAFGMHPECKFLVRIDASKVANAHKRAEEMGITNVVIRHHDERIKQQEILGKNLILIYSMFLAQKNVHGMVFHCGQNSLNEV